MGLRPRVDLFCDGACLGNPGPGGWAYLLRLRAPDASGAEGRAPDASGAEGRAPDASGAEGRAPDAAGGAREKGGVGPREKEGGGAEGQTTNNRMELRGAIEGLRALTRPCDVRLLCDSQYIVKGIGSWLADWKSRGWRKADGRPPLNEDLWRELDALLGVHRVEAAWVRGHAGHPENERVDAAARAMAAAIAQTISTHPHCRPG